MPQRTQKAVSLRMSSRRIERGISPKVERWTPEEEQKVIDAILRGDDDLSIAKNLERTKSSVEFKVSDLKKRGCIPNVDRRTKVGKSEQ